MHHHSGLCGYAPIGKCFNVRATKANGQPHSLCAYHRERQTINQRKRDQKLRMLRLMKNQSYTKVVKEIDHIELLRKSLLANGNGINPLMLLQRQYAKKVAIMRRHTSSEVRVHRYFPSRIYPMPSSMVQHSVWLHPLPSIKVLLNLAKKQDPILLRSSDVRPLQDMKFHSVYWFSLFYFIYFANLT